MVVNISLKRILPWLFGIIVVLAAIPYLRVELLLQSSYKHFALDEYTEAVADAKLATLISHFLYPASSKHYQEMVLYDLKVSSRFGTMGVSFGGGPKNLTVSEVVEFAKQNEGRLSPEEMLSIRVAGAQAANATTHGQGVSLIGGATDDTQAPDSILSAYLKEERAYADMTGLLIFRSPKNADEQKQNDWGYELASKQHEDAQHTICKSDVVNCRFNTLRWQIGTCVRRAYSSQTPICTAGTLRDVTTFAGAACKDLKLDQCYSVMTDLLPYYHSLLQAEGSSSSIAPEDETGKAIEQKGAPTGRSVSSE